MAVGVGVAVASSREAVPASAASGDTYTLVTDASKLASGDTLIIVSEGKGDALSTTQNKNNRGVQAVTISNHTTSFVSGVQDITLSGSSSAWILTAGSVRLSGVNGQNYLKDGTDTWTIAINSTTGVATITSAVSSRVIKRNTSSALYATYSSGQTDVQIYKKDAAKTLSSIAVTTEPTTTTYYVGDSFDPTGMVVTATYSDASTKNVTSSCTFSPATFSSTGNQNVTISYEENSVAKTTTQAVTVNAARTITGVTLLGDMTKKSYKNGDEWDVSGLYLSVTWSSGDPTTVQLTSLTKDTDYLMDPDSASEGDTSVDIEGDYEGFAFSKTVTGITVTAAPDVINQAFTGVSGSGYTDWSGKAGSSGSGAVYAGNSSAGTDIQMRAQSPSGIWTTASGGIFNGIEVTWNASTAAARSIEIYGKGSAYASADLYDNSAKGTLIGSIANGESTIEGDLGEYEYIGIKPIGGALYLTEIDIYWTAANPVIEYENSSTTADLVVINGSTNAIDFNAKHFASVSAGIFSNAPTNSNSSYANLSYSVSGTTVTIIVTGKAVGSESFTISATGCANTLTLNVTVQASTTFDSLVISTATTATSFNEDEAFAVTGLVVTANYTVGGSPSTVEFSASEGNLDQLTYTVGGSPIEIGDPLTSTGTLSVVVSYTDTATGTTRSASAYNITVNAYVAHTWTKVTTAPADWRGTYLLGYEVDGTLYAFNSDLETFDVTFNTVNTTDISGDVVTGSKAIDAAAVKIERNTVSGTSYYHALCANGQYLKSASKSINHQASATAANAVTFDGVSLKIGDYWLRFNTANNQLRFRFGDSSYLSTSSASLYKMNVTSAINTEVSNFVSGFHSSIGGVCDESGVDTDTSALNSAWTTQATAFKALSVDAQGILANTTYTHNAETAGSTADIIDRYDYVYGKYSASLTKGDFMNRSDAGTLVAYSARVNPLNIVGENGSTAAIIVVVSLVSLTAIGGYFFIRKRKEQ
jgi:hypothetical protein